MFLNYFVDYVDVQASNTNLVKKKYPAYSLSKRFNVPADRTPKPGPGAYVPEKVGDHTQPIVAKLVVFSD